MLCRPERVPGNPSSSVNIHSGREVFTAWQKSATSARKKAPSYAISWSEKYMEMEREGERRFSRVAPSTGQHRKPSLSPKKERELGCSHHHAVGCREVSRALPFEHLSRLVGHTGRPHRQQRRVQRQVCHPVQSTELWALRSKLQPVPTTRGLSIQRYKKTECE